MQQKNWKNCKVQGTYELKRRSKVQQSLCTLQQAQKCNIGMRFARTYSVRSQGPRGS